MITSSDILYIYCEIMEQLEPKKVLDIGMFYKAIGCVSRRILNKEVPECCFIEGVCIDKAETLGVYETIYDKIIDEKDFDELNENDFDLAVMLSDELSKADRVRFIRRVSESCSYLLTYEDDVTFLETASDIKSLKIGEDSCVLAVFGKGLVA